MKTCSKCHIEKSLTEFRFIRKNKNGTDLYRAKCNDCYNGHYIEKYRQKDDAERKEIYKEKKKKLSFDERKDWRLRYRFGISLNEYNQMLIEQDNQCYICHKHIDGYDIKVDHCHKTNRVRKLLCHKCNTVLGLINEDKEILLKCIEYLEQHDYIRDHKVA